MTMSQSARSNMRPIREIAINMSSLKRINRSVKYTDKFDKASNSDYDFYLLHLLLSLKCNSESKKYQLSI